MELPICFVIMPISNQSGYEDNHFQLVYEDIIKPSINKAKMTPVRADETKNTNLIHMDILKKILESPIALCDMSARNPNVFYELGLRQAFDLPTVLLIDNVTEAPFDISGLRYVTYNKEMKHRSVISSIEELASTLIDTYKKRDDKTEINSLIRLLELTTPARIGQVDLSEEERYEKLNELHFQEIKSSIDSLKKTQTSILNYLDVARNLPKTLADIGIGSQADSIEVNTEKTKTLRPLILKTGKSQKQEK